MDGNDLFAVYRATREAVNHARTGKGPVLIEAETYRTAEEEALWVPRDPLIRLKAYLEERGLWSTKQEGETSEQITLEVEAAFREAEQFPANDIEENVRYAQIITENKFYGTNSPLFQNGQRIRLGKSLSENAKKGVFCGFGQKNLKFET